MPKIKIQTSSPKETFLVAQFLGEEILKSKKILSKPLIIALYGNLGSGKTLFTQGLATGLKIRNKIKSPTFLILKKYKIKNHKFFKNFYHIDAYRIKSVDDIKNSGIEQALKDKNAILTIEWADIIKAVLPPQKINIHFKHRTKDLREIILELK